MWNTDWNSQLAVPTERYFRGWGLHTCNDDAKRDGRELKVNGNQAAAHPKGIYSPTLDARGRGN
jgi:hypothetical protein